MKENTTLLTAAHGYTDDLYEVSFKADGSIAGGNAACRYFRARNAKGGSMAISPSKMV
jgi:hypothetical protein